MQENTLFLCRFPAPERKKTPDQQAERYSIIHSSYNIKININRWKQMK